MSEVTKDEVAQWFSIDVEELKGAKILYAMYETPSYEGYAFVLFKQNGKLYEVNGSHCSCYGLEDQWGPEETSVEALQHRFDKGHGFYYCDRNEIEKVFKKLKTAEKRAKAKK